MISNKAIFKLWLRYWKSVLSSFAKVITNIEMHPHIDYFYMKVWFMHRLLESLGHLWLMYFVPSISKCTKFM